MATTSNPLNALPVSNRSLKQQIRTFTAFYKQHRTAITRSIYAALFVATINRYRNAIKAQKAAVAQARASRRGLATGKAEDGDEKPRRRRVGIDKDFWIRLSRLIRICIPGWRSKEAGLLASYSVFLVLRTMMSLYIADLDGRVVGHLVKGQGKKFLKSVVLFFCMGIPALLINAGITLHHSQLAISFRRRLTHYIHNQYLNNMTFYTLSALDDRIKNADQMIVSDVAKFSNSLAELYGSLSKPILDLTLCCWRIRRSIGDEALFGMGLAVTLTNTVLTALAPPFGQLSAEEAKLEGELRNQHTRLIDWSEEIALYFGHEAEKDTLDRTYFELIKHINRIIRRRLFYGVAQDYVLKYVWGALGQMITAIPIFIQGAQLKPSRGTGEKAESLVTMRRLLMNASEAFERLMGSYRDIAQLAGYTSRVNELLEVIADTQRGHFEKALVSSASTEANAAVLAGRGEQEEGDDIKFDGVPIVSPNGDILVKALSFHICRGDHLLVIGPNGCGKSSLFRILGGLWPVYGGKVRKPPSEDIFYVPQRPYLSKGTLRQQILYPDNLLDMRARKVTDRDLIDILEKLSLTHLLAGSGSKHSSSSREVDGLDREAEWTSVLSTGDQQRIAAARLFYHSPAYAILDECTSSLTPEIERIIYTEAQRLNITLMTVSHRRSLWTYHGWILQFDGQGGYVFAQLDAEKRLRLEDEKDELEMQLRAVPELERRIAELEAGTGDGGGAGVEDGDRDGAGVDDA